MLDTGVNVLGVLGALRVALPRVRFDTERCRAALERDFTQATDLAEALVRRGIPFRTAYQRVGTLVRRAQEAGVGLLQAKAIASTLDAALGEALESLGDVSASVANKQSTGGTAPGQVEHQIAALREAADWARAAAASVPRLVDLFRTLAGAAP